MGNYPSLAGYPASQLASPLHFRLASNNIGRTGFLLSAGARVVPEPSKIVSLLASLAAIIIIIVIIIIIMP